MSDESLLSEIRDLAARWRYEFGNEQQMSDGLELLQLLKKHGVPWPREKATEVVPYNGTCPHGKLNQEFCVGCHPRSVAVARP